MTPNTGTYVSGIGHGVLILWALIGGFFLRSNDPLPLQSTEVSLLTSEEFAALSVPEASPTVPTEAPEVVAPLVDEAEPQVAPTVDAAPEAVEPAPAPEPEPEPAPVVDVSDDAPILPEPPSEQATTAERTIPDTKAQPAPAPRVAPEPAAEPEPDAEIADTVTPEVTPDAEAEAVAEEEPATAPLEATTEIVTEAEKPSAPLRRLLLTPPQALLRQTPPLRRLARR